ncbi:hypothetical protein Tco_0690670 [Tanacetum coccineum]
MSNLKFVETHILVAFLEKPKESDGFEGIIDFLNATVKAKTVNREVHIQALIDGKKVIVTKTSVRRDLHLEDAEGTDCLPTTTIFAELERMGYEKLIQKLTFYKAFFSPQWKFLIHTILQCLSAKTTAWNEFSSTMASAIICLATNQKFNFSKYIFDNLVKNLEGGVKFLMYSRFVQIFLDKQVGDMSTHNRTYDAPCHTKKIFANMMHPVTVQAPKEIVNKLEKKKNSRSHGLRRLYKVGRSRRVEPFKESLGDQEDASKQGRKIDEIDQDVENMAEKVVDMAKKDVSTIDPVTTVDEVVTTANVEVSTASATTTTVDELNLAQTLIEIKAAKPKAVTTAATIVTPVNTRPMAKGIIFHDQEEQSPASTRIVSSSQSL